MKKFKQLSLISLCLAFVLTSVKLPTASNISLKGHYTHGTVRI